MTDYDTEPPPTDPFGTAASILSTETSERRTAHIFGSIVREEMAAQLAPVRSALTTIADEQQRLAEELRSLADRVTSLESRRQTVALGIVAASALVLSLVALGAHAIRPHVVMAVPQVDAP